MADRRHRPPIKLINLLVKECLVKLIISSLSLLVDVYKCLVPRSFEAYAVGTPITLPVPLLKYQQGIIINLISNKQR